MSGALFLTLIILFAVLHFLGGIVLALHRISLRYGLLPLVFFLGGLAAALQFRSLGMVSIQWGGEEMLVAIGSYTLLPTLLLGLLIIYIANGTTQARNAFYGLLIVTVFAAASQIFPIIYQTLPGVFALQANPGSPEPGIPVASAITLAVDMIVITTAYQAGSNLRKRAPSRLAAAAALMLALFSDAIIFPTLTYIGSTGWPNQATFNLVGKTVSGLILTPVILVYLAHIQKTFPPNASTASRPILDLFTPQAQLEAQAQYQYGLLRTISQINQLILRTTQPMELLQQSCKQLCQGRDYALVWIGLFDKQNVLAPEKARLRAVVKAGPLVEQLGSLIDEQYITAAQASLSETVLATKRANVFKALTIRGASPINEDSNRPWFIAAANPAWQNRLTKAGISVCAAFPMRCTGAQQEEQLLGILCIYANRLETFDSADEISLLQELADDLAYALVSLDARQQQAFLSTAAETMRDGLLITNLRGDLIYANPATLEMLGLQAQDVIKKRLFDLMPADEVGKFKQDYLQLLIQKEQFTTEVNMSGPQGRLLISVKAALVRNSSGRASHVVISVRDITARRIYEQRLLALNQIATQLVQIYELEEIYQIILRAGNDLLEATAGAIILTDLTYGTIAEIYPHELPGACLAALQSQALKPSAALKTIFQQPLYIEKISNTEFDFLTNNGIQAMMSLPIFYQESSWGSLCFFYQQPRLFDDADKQLGLAVSNRLGMAIKNAQLYLAEHRQRQLSEALAQATAMLNSSLDLDTVLDRILNETIRVVPCRSTSLMLIEGAQARIVRQLLRSSSGKIEGVSGGQVIPLNTPTLLRMLETGEPVLISDTVLNKEWCDFGLTTWIRSYASAPLQIRQETIGFLNVNSDKAGFFTDDILPSLKGFAFNASAAIHNARLYRELQSRTLDLEDRIHERTLELSSAKDLLEAILASVPDAVFVLDENGLLLNANRAGAVLLLETEKSGADLFENEFIRRIESGETQDEITVIEIQQRAYQVLASPLPIKETQTGMIIVFRDVTHFHELDRMKNQFVSDVSHELRTPLTSLSLYLDLLSNETNEERRQRFQVTLRRETDRLTQLIEDLLTISRLESKRIPFNLCPTDMYQLANDLAEDRIPIAAQRNIHLHCSACPQQAIAETDPRLITQVLSNLLTNAINYTPPGGNIDILIECLKNNTGEHPGGHPGNWITIAIQDTGVGIAPEEMPNIFERFYRGSASRQTGSAGTGLGLAISKEILDHMNGQITVESEIGKGSTFTVWLPAVL